VMVLEDLAGRLFRVIPVQRSCPLERRVSHDVANSQDAPYLVNAGNSRFERVGAGVEALRRFFSCSDALRCAWGDVLLPSATPNRVRRSGKGLEPSELRPHRTKGARRPPGRLEINVTRRGASRQVLARSLASST
jgi:hypothetical protein